MAQLGLSTDSRLRHDRFVQRAVTSGIVWGLKSDNGWITSSSTAEQSEGRGIMPFWSDRAYARQCAKGGWAHCEPTQILLDVFIDRWMPGMDVDGLLVGTNWNAHLCGYEIAPLVLRDQLAATRLVRFSTMRER